MYVYGTDEGFNDVIGCRRITRERKANFLPPTRGDEQSGVDERPDAHDVELAKQDLVDGVLILDEERQLAEEVLVAGLRVERRRQF